MEKEVIIEDEYTINGKQYKFFKSESSHCIESPFAFDCWSMIDICPNNKYNKHYGIFIEKNDTPKRLW